MNWLTYISALTFLIFNVTSIIKIKRVPDNLSDTFYIWQKPKFTFPLVLSVISLSMLPQWAVCAEKFSCEYLMYITALGITIVCFVSDYRSKTWKFIIHIASAYTAGFAAAAFILIISGWQILISSIAVTLLLWLIFDKHKATTFEFWLEFVVFSSLFTIFIFY